MAALGNMIYNTFETFEMNDRMTESGIPWSEAADVMLYTLVLRAYFRCRTESLPWSGVFFCSGLWSVSLSSSSALLRFFS